MILHKDVVIETRMTHLFDWWAPNGIWYPFQWPYRRDYPIDIHPAYMHYEVLWGDVR